MSDPHDVARYIFVNDENELRSGWRVLLFFIILVTVATLLSVLGIVLATLFPSIAFVFTIPPGPDYSGSPARLVHLCVSTAMNLLAAVIASIVCASLLERRRFGSVGFKLHRGWSRDFAFGSLLGAASLAIAVGIAASVGAVTFDLQTREFGLLLRGFLVTLAFFVIAGANEELIFRGFPFQALVHNLRGPRAVAITSLIFGLAHASNPEASVFSTINTILAGIWLGIAYLMTRSLWLATALHWSWNFAMVFIFGLPVSGLTTLGAFSWLRGSPGEPGWISGGGYGPEAGVAATLALILSTLAIWKSGLFAASQEMLNAIRHGKAQPDFVKVTPESEGSAVTDHDGASESGGSTMSNP
ncbi:MAG TPA: type II CAAX endopeptidase family protein [Blastocatellia bacterium]|nr:type II CAAX endopeptidase family protein [Blastocatellia bacterium]